MKKILPYLRYIVPIACILSVTIVIFMAMKVSDLKDQREAKQTEYNTAAEEFFGEENIVQNETSENVVENEVEEEEEEKKPFITTYDINELDEENVVDEEVVEDEEDSSEKQEEARGLIVKILGEEDFTITYKETSENGEYIFEVEDKAKSEKVLKRVNLENKTVQTITSE